MKRIRPKEKVCDLCGEPVFYPCQCVVSKSGKVLFHRIFIRFPWIKTKYYHIDCAEKVKNNMREEKS